MKYNFFTIFTGNFLKPQNVLLDETEILGFYQMKRVSNSQLFLASRQQMSWAQCAVSQMLRLQGGTQASHGYQVTASAAAAEQNMARQFGMQQVRRYGGRGAALKRSFDICLLLEGLFPCCCFFPLGGMKQAHHKNCERPLAHRPALWHGSPGERAMCDSACAALGQQSSANGLSVCELEWVTRIPCTAAASTSSGHHICSPQILHRHTLTQRWQSLHARVD